MSTIIIVLIIWWIAQRLEAIRQNRRIQRIREEQARQRAEQARQREEQARARREQARLEQEQRRQAREQERMDEALKRHEDQLVRLTQRLELAEREISHYSPVLEALEKQAEILDNKVWWYEKNGLPCQGIKQELDKIKAKAYQVETKIIKAQQTKAFCQKKIAA